MAVVTIPKIVKCSIKNTINYVANQSKTVLSENGEQTMFCSGINCSREPDKAIEGFLKTRERYGKGKPDGKSRLAYHYVLSLPPDVGTPEMAHSLALEFCERAWHGEYQIYLGTHLDKNHIHTHIVLNAVSQDGKMYHEDRDEVPRLRAISDDLCKENGLPLIVETGAGSKKYKDWADLTQAREDNKASNRMQKLKDDLDVCISKSNSLTQLETNLQGIGYKVKLHNEHISVLVPGMERYRRLDTLFGQNYSPYSLSLIMTGSGYTPQRYKEQPYVPRPKASFKRPVQKKPYLVVNKVVYRNLPRWAKKALATERKLQRQRSYLKTARPYMSVSMYEYERKETHKLCREIRLLQDLGKQIEKSGSLTSASDEYYKLLEEKLAERKRVYRRIQRAEDPEQKENLKKQRDSLSEEIKYLRTQIAYCEELNYEAYQEQNSKESDTQVNEPEVWDKTKEEER